MTNPNDGLNKSRLLNTLTSPVRTDTISAWAHLISRYPYDSCYQSYLYKTFWWPEVYILVHIHPYLFFLVFLTSQTQEAFFHQHKWCSSAEKILPVIWSAGYWKDSNLLEVCWGNGFQVSTYQAPVWPCPNKIELPPASSTLPSPT